MYEGIDGFYPSAELEPTVPRLFLNSEDLGILSSEGLCLRVMSSREEFNVGCCGDALALYNIQNLRGMDGDDDCERFYESVRRYAPFIVQSVVSTGGELSDPASVLDELDNAGRVAIIQAPVVFPNAYKMDRFGYPYDQDQYPPFGKIGQVELRPSAYVLVVDFSGGGRISGRGRIWRYLLPIRLWRHLGERAVNFGQKIKRRMMVGRASGSLWMSFCGWKVRKGYPMHYIVYVSIMVKKQLRAG